MPPGNIVAAEEPAVEQDEGLIKAREDALADRKKKSKDHVIYAVVMASIGGFLYGYDTGVISGAILVIARMMDLGTFQQEMVVSFMLLAAFFSSLVGGVVNKLYGRRKTLLIGSFITTIGALAQACAWDYDSLCVGRVIVGLGIGLLSLTSPIYIAEIPKSEDRGQLVTVNAFAMAIGQFCAGMSDGIFDMITPDSGWRYMLGLMALPAAIMFVNFLNLPETPRWLAMNERQDEAIEILKSIRDSDEEAEQELKDIILTLPPTLPPGEEKGFVRKTWEMVRDQPTRRALILGCGIMALQQLIGINTVTYYAATIFEDAGYSELASIWLSGFTALAKVAGVGISVYLVEREGRRPLVLTSLVLLALGLIGLGFAFLVYRVTTEPVTYAIGYCISTSALVWDGETEYCYDCANIDGCGFCDGVCTEGNSTGPYVASQCPAGSEWTYDLCTNNYSYLSVGFMIAYLLAFSVGMQGLPWTINSEIYPLQYRSIAASFATATNWIFNYIISATYLTLSSTAVLTAYGAFWFYAGIAVVGFVWLFFVLPETKGLSLEEIEQVFRKKPTKTLDADESLLMTEEER